jgi:hypothetical protein
MGDLRKGRLKSERFVNVADQKVGKELSYRRAIEWVLSEEVGVLLGVVRGVHGR